jgi:hypothetical protein
MYNSPYHNHNQLQQSSNNNVPPFSPNLSGPEQQYVVSQPWRDPDQEALEIGERVLICLRRLLINTMLFLDAQVCFSRCKSLFSALT